MNAQSFPKPYRTYLVLFAVLFVSLFIRLWLLDKRWINPDEGAHLMDAALVLDGKIPRVDFDSRQPLYIYALASFLKIFGTDYIAGRLLLITCSMLVGIVVFLMARTLFDVKVALLSSTVYWMLPLELLQSSVVKMEPLAVLLICLSVYAVVRFSQYSRGVWLITAGVFAAMGSYVRESTMVIPLVAFGFIVLFHGGRVRGVAKHFGTFLGGYSAVVLVVLGFYSRFMSLGDLLTRTNPTAFLLWAGEKLVSLFVLSSGSTNMVASQVADVPRELYYRYIHEAFHMHSFLLIGLALSVAALGYDLFTANRQKIREYVNSYSILYLWVFFLSLAYAFFFYTTAFHIDYFREFLPPLVIILSAWICRSAPGLEKDGVLELVIPAGLCLSAVWFFFMQSDNTGLFGVAQQASLAIAIVAPFYFGSTFEYSARRCVFVATLWVLVALLVVMRLTTLQPYLSGPVPSLGIIGMVYGLTWALLGRDAKPSPVSYAKFVGLSIVLGTLVVSVGYSGDKLSLDYNSTWSPHSVERTAEYVKTYTRDDDEVMSGAVIWEFQALRRPFQMITHPLTFIHNISEEKRQAITRAAAMRPPKVIILDGYTEKTYMRRIPRLMELLRARYEFVTDEGPAKYPIRIYRLKHGTGHVASDL